MKISNVGFYKQRPEDLKMQKRQSDKEKDIEIKEDEIEATDFAPWDEVKMIQSNNMTQTNFNRNNLGVNSSKDGFRNEPAIFRKTQV